MLKGELFGVDGVCINCSVDVLSWGSILRLVISACSEGQPGLRLED